MTLFQSLTDYTIFSLVLSLSCFIQGILGFGFVILGLPVLLLLGFQDKSLVGVFIGLSFFVNLFMLYQHKDSIKETPKPIYLVMGGLIVIYPSLRYLTSVNVDQYTVYLGALVLILTTLLAFKLQIKVKRQGLYLALVGALSGVMQVVFAMSGPFLAFFLAQKKEHVRIFKTRMILYYTVMNIVTLAAYLSQGLLTSSTLVAALPLIVPTCMGLSAGHYCTRFISTAVFRRLLVMMLYLIAVILMLR